MPATMPGLIRQLEALIRDVPDFPKPGIVFKDITPLLSDPAGLCLAVELMANPFRKAKVDLVCGAESRGFIFGTAIAQALGAGFVPIRKPGKLPSKTIRETYALEYGTDTLEMHADAVQPGQRVLMVDDLLATGGTMKAALDLLKRSNADVVGATVLIELTSLGGRRRLEPTPLHSALAY
ncbi:MAG: adenine phosphoribosyltransferase [Phycisphaerae bacterium]|nr:adenine phosphoribosyltransferase [Phycisphaerae bacterium]